MIYDCPHVWMDILGDTVCVECGHISTEEELVLELPGLEDGRFDDLDVDLELE